jgi:hypothetical protein
MTLSPQQKKMLAIGVPIVAVLGVVALLRRGSGSSASTSSTPTTTASTSAVDAGQLAAFETALGGQLSAWEASQLSGTTEGQTAVNPIEPIWAQTGPSGSAQATMAPLSGFEVSPTGSPYVTSDQFYFQTSQPLSAANIAANGQGGSNDLSGMAGLNGGSGPSPEELAYFDAVNQAKAAA